MPSRLLTVFSEWKPVAALIVSIFATGWGTAWFVSNTVGDLNAGRDVVQREMVEIRKDLIDLQAQMKDDRYTLTAASEKALRTAIENPGMRVPDPRDPDKIISVREGTP